MTAGQQSVYHTTSCCLKTEEYVNEHNSIVNVAVLNHITGDQEETEQRFVERVVSPSLSFVSLSNYEHEQLCVAFG